MEPKKPVFPSINSTQKTDIKNNHLVNAFVNPLENSEPQASSPKVATNAKRKLLSILFIAIVIIIATVVTVLIITTHKTQKINDISIKISLTEDAQGNTLNTGFDFTELEENRTYVDSEGNSHIRIYPGDKFGGKLALTSLKDENNPTLAGNVVVRCRVFAVADDVYIGNIFNYKVSDDNISDWFASEFDGYIYYNNLLSVDETIYLNLDVEISGAKAGNELQGKSISLCYSFEVLQASADQSIREVWFSSPYEWRVNIANKVLNSK